jgi:hemoglobin/transferrin/lactoferrin receptor protein
VYNAELPNGRLAPSEENKTHIYATDANGNPYSPSWYTLNLKGSYDVTDHLNVGFGVENITDVRYRPYSSGMVAPGINMMGSLRARF